MVSPVLLVDGPLTDGPGATTASAFAASSGAVHDRQTRSAFVQLCLLQGSGGGSGTRARAALRRHASAANGQFPASEVPVELAATFTDRSCTTRASPFAAARGAVRVKQTS